MAEGAPLLRVYRIYLLSRVRIPLSPPKINNPAQAGFFIGVKKIEAYCQSIIKNSPKIEKITLRLEVE